MSRHGYVDNDCDDGLALGRWRGMVKSATNGNRGQKLLRDMRDALDAMPVKRLIVSELVTAEGECCAMGAVALHRGIAVDGIDPEEPDQVAAAFDIAECLAREIAYENDEYSVWPRTKTDDAEARWLYMRKWVEKRIKPTPEPTP